MGSNFAATLNIWVYHVFFLCVCVIYSKELMDSVKCKVRFRLCPLIWCRTDGLPPADGRRAECTMHRTYRIKTATSVMWYYVLIDYYFVTIISKGIHEFIVAKKKLIALSVILFLCLLIIRYYIRENFSTLLWYYI